VKVRGTLPSTLRPENDLLVRVGGPNAGHKVPLDPPVTLRSLPFRSDLLGARNERRPEGDQLRQAADRRQFTGAPFALF
jgi:hypothetical protein